MSPAGARDLGLFLTDTRHLSAWRLLVKTPIQALSRSWALAPLVALYYVPALPVGLALNALDLRKPNARGTGHLMVAQRP